MVEIKQDIAEEIVYTDDELQQLYEEEQRKEREYWDIIYEQYI